MHTNHPLPIIVFWLYTQYFGVQHVQYGKNNQPAMKKKLPFLNSLSSEIQEERGFLVLDTLLSWFGGLHQHTNLADYHLCIIIITHYVIFPGDMHLNTDKDKDPPKLIIVAIDSAFAAYCCKKIHMYFVICTNKESFACTVETHR